jgi:hypothetical protein
MLPDLEQRARKMVKSLRGRSGYALIGGVVVDRSAGSPYNDTPTAYDQADLDNALQLSLLEKRKMTIGGAGGGTGKADFDWYVKPRKDLFYVIGFTKQDILTGAHMQLMQRVLDPAERRLIEVYFADPFVLPDNSFEKRYGKKYQTVFFYNEAAKELSGKYSVQLPEEFDEIMRDELPVGYGVSMGSMKR